MAADVPDPARLAGRAVAGAATARGAAARDRPASRRHRRDRALVVAWLWQRPQRRGRTVRPDLDRQGASIRRGPASPGPRSATCATASRPICWARRDLAAGRRLGSVAHPRHGRDRWPSPARAARRCGRAGRSRAVRSAVALFGVTFVAGEVFNLYSQPQDAQMQVNVMPWLTLAWLFALQAAAARWRPRPAAMAGVGGHCCSPTMSGACAAARPRLALEVAFERARTAGRSGAHGVRGARLRLGDDLRLAPLGRRGARDRPPRPAAAGAAEVQVDRLHGPAAAAPGLVGRAANGRPAPADRSRPRARLRRAGGPARDSTRTSSSARPA